MAGQNRRLDDKELLSIFQDPRADLSLLEPEEHQRLLKLTEAQPAVPMPPAASAGMPLSEQAVQPPLPPPPDSYAGMPKSTTTGPRSVVERFQQDYPDVQTQGEPISPFGVLGAAGAAAGAAKLANVVKTLPSRAKAGAKFEQVMSAVGHKPVDLGGPVSTATMRIAELSERGGSLPKVVRDLLKRGTDPTKAEPTYREMRDFYSNISSLSGKEMKRLSPIVRREMGELRVALDAAMEKVAASGGMESVYRDAMREYAVASKMRNFAEKAVKYGIGVAGATAAYNVVK